MLREFALKRLITLLAGALLGIAFLPSADAATVFFDDFSSPDFLERWEFSGGHPNHTDFWHAAAGRLESASEQTEHISHINHPGFGRILDLATPDHFSIEADVSIVGEVPRQRSGYGHAGFVFDAADFSSFNNTYLRTHDDEVTTWGRDGGINLGQRIMSFAGSFDVVPDLEYHLKLEVDYISQDLTVELSELDGSLIAEETFSGGDFIGGSNSGAGIGVLTWGERVSYDNVRVFDYDYGASGSAQWVSEPAPLALTALGLLPLALRRMHSTRLHRRAHPTQNAASRIRRRRPTPEHCHDASSARLHAHRARRQSSLRAASGRGCSCR